MRFLGSHHSLVGLGQLPSLPVGTRSQGLVGADLVFRLSSTSVFPGDPRKYHDPRRLAACLSHCLSEFESLPVGVSEKAVDQSYSAALLIIQIKPLALPKHIRDGCAAACGLKHLAPTQTGPPPRIGCLVVSPMKLIPRISAQDQSRGPFKEAVCGAPITSHVTSESPEPVLCRESMGLDPGLSCNDSRWCVRNRTAACLASGLVRAIELPALPRCP